MAWWWSVQCRAHRKDDRFDAYVLADVLRTDRARMQPLQRDSDQTMTLRMTVRTRQDLVHARVAMGNQLRAHLQARVVAFRWAVDKQLRGAVIDFAGDSWQANPWANDLYRRARARRLDHPHAVRILARAWLHIIWRCWQDGVPYDPTKHGALQRLVDQAA